MAMILKESLRLSHSVGFNSAANKAVFAGVSRILTSLYNICERQQQSHNIVYVY